MRYDNQSLIMAERLRTEREKRNLNYTELETAISIGADSLKNYETNERHHTKFLKNYGMSAKNLCLLADYYGVSTDYLLGRTNEPVPDPTIQSVHHFTGLHSAAIKTLHSYDIGTIERSFINRFLDDLLTDSAIATIISEALQKYAYAYKLSVSQKLSLNPKNRKSDGLPIYENGKYKITPDEAAKFYLSYAVGAAQGCIEAIIKQMADEMSRPNYIAPPKEEYFKDFRWQVYSEDAE